MELYYAGYTVGWPVGLGETLIKTITTAGLKTMVYSSTQSVHTVCAAHSAYIAIYIVSDL